LLIVLVSQLDFRAGALADLLVKFRLGVAHLLPAGGGVCTHGQRAAEPALVAEGSVSSDAALEKASTLLAIPGDLCFSSLSQSLAQMLASREFLRMWQVL